MSRINFAENLIYKRKVRVTYCGGKLFNGFGFEPSVRVGERQRVVVKTMGRKSCKEVRLRRKHWVKSVGKGKINLSED